MNNCWNRSISFQIVSGETRAVSHVSYFKVQNNQVVSLVNVAAAPQITEEGELAILRFGRFDRPFRALWDTGATRTVVEPRVIDELELISETWVTIRGVDGRAVDRPAYEIILILSKFPMNTATHDENLISLYPVTAIKLERNGQLGGEIDILIGMDVISSVDFAISRGNDGELWCSIRHPSSGYRTIFDGLS